MSKWMMSNPAKQPSPTYDGRTGIDLSDSIHTAARAFVNIAVAQDNEVGPVAVLGASDS